MAVHRAPTLFLLALFVLAQLCVFVPQITAVTITSSSISPSSFSPDDNSLNDTTTITIASTAGQDLYVNIFNQTSSELVAEDRIMTENPSGTYKYTWNGKDDSNDVVEEGTYTVRVSDNPSQNGDTIDTVDVDLTPPSSPSLSIAGGATYTTSQSVTLTISATGASKMQISNYDNDFANASWENYATSKSWTLRSGDGTKTVYINFRDTAGTNVSTSDTITLDTTLDDPSLSINSGSSSTNNRTVTLTITASGATYMKIDNNTDFSNMSSWIAKTSSRSFTMPSGADGVRTVYLRVKDDAGNIKTTSDTITLDTTAPADLTLSINSGASYTNSTWVNLSISAGSGPSMMYFSNTGSTWTGYTYAVSHGWNLSSTDGTKTVYFKAADSAGNNATAITASITLDTTAPSPAQLSLPSDGGTETTQTPTFTWTDPNPSGTKNFLIEILQSGSVIQSSSPNATTLTYTASTLSTGTYAWRVTVYDMANNSAVTSQRSFTISISGLAAPTPKYPANNAQVNDTTPIIVWYAVSGTSISYDLKYGLSSDNLNRTYSTSNVYYEIPIQYSNGQTIYWAVRARNTTLTSSYSSTISFTVDTQAPTSLTISINSGSTSTSSSSITLTLSASGATWMKISNSADFTGASWEAYATSKSWTLSGTDGIKTVYFKAKDSAGVVTSNYEWSTTYANIASTVSDTIIYDTEGPMVSNASPTSGATITNTQPEISVDLLDNGTGINDSRVYITVDSVNQTTNATIDNVSVVYTPGSALGYTTHTVNITAYDLAGYVGYLEWTFTVEEEEAGGGGPGGGGVTESSITITGVTRVPTTVTSDDTVNISATVSATAGISRVRLYYSHGSSSTSIVMSNTSSKFYATIGPFSAGLTVTYYIHATDLNLDTEDSQNYSFTVVDTVAPVITIVSPTDGSSITNRKPTIEATYIDSGTINTNSVVLTLDETNITALATVTATGVTYTPATDLSYSEHTVTLVVKDQSGNTATATWSFTVSVEEQELTKTVTELVEGEATTVDFSDSGTALEEITIIPASDMENLTVSCTITGERPDDVTTPPNTVYMYLIIETSADASAISSAVITFKVEQSWFVENNINKTAVRLVRYHDGWHEITPTIIAEDDTYVHYDAETTGFSTFAITGETTKFVSEGSPWLFVLIIIVVLAIIAIVVLLYYKGII